MLNMSPIHVASILQKDYLFLRKEENRSYRWLTVDRTFEREEKTLIQGITPVEAIFEGYRAWKDKGFRLLHCGFRYSLPERDQVGSNALFWQMALSYNSFNGRYFDEEVGHLCYVDFASQEAQGIWRKIRLLKPSVNTHA